MTIIFWLWPHSLYVLIKYKYKYKYSVHNTKAYNFARIAGQNCSKIINCNYFVFKFSAVVNLKKFWNLRGDGATLCRRWGQGILHREMEEDENIDRGNDRSRERRSINDRNLPSPTQVFQKEKHKKEKGGRPKFIAGISICLRDKRIFILYIFSISLILIWQKQM